MNMKMMQLPLVMLLALCPSLASAGVSIHINLGLPVAPPLVEVEPGIRVVEGFRDEVFLHDGWYWCRRPDGWYRAHSPRDRFDRMDSYRVPGVLMRQPMGRYRYWHHDDRRYQSRPYRGHERSYRGEDWPEPRREERNSGHGREDASRGRGRRPLFPPQYP